MKEQIESCFRDLLAALQTAKLYATAHPMFKKAVDKAYASLEDVLRERDELVIGIVGEEIAFEKEIFFDLSKLTRPAILYLKERNIEKIAFYRGLQREELDKFIAFLAAPKEEIKTDPQQYLALKGIKNIACGKVLTTPGAEGRSAKEAVGALGLYESSSDKVSQSLTGVLNLEAIDHLSLKFSLNNLMENLSTQHQELLKLTTLKRYDVGTFAHLLNVSILSMYFASKLGFAKDEVMDIGIAALFHDIGKLYISRKIITKAAKLSDEEFMRIKSHTVLGAELLLKYTETLGILPVVVAFEHHLKYNLTGYPKLSYPQRPHLASLIVSTCDIYDALSERRGYKADYPPDMIYNLMLKEKGSTFAPELIDRFFKIIGIWPIGSVVALSDERVALVISENEDDISLPKVEVIHPADKKEVIDLKLRKNELKIARFLNPWTEGKEFLHLIKDTTHA